MSTQYLPRRPAGGVSMAAAAAPGAHFSDSSSNRKVIFSPATPLSPWSSSTSSVGSAGSPPKFQGGAASIPTSSEQFRLALREIESKLLEDDDDEAAAAALPPAKSVEEMSDPAQLLLLSAEAVSGGDLALASRGIDRLHRLVSICGSPMERLAAYMVEGLVARLQSSGKGLCAALKCRQPSLTAAPAQRGEVLSAMQVMYEVCPYIKFGYMAANGAIAEAFRGEPRVHIVDFEIAQGTQYIALIQALALRPGGPPSLRITGVSDPAADVAAPGGIHVVGQRLSRLAASVGLPFEFVGIPVNAARVTGDELGRRADEALAINFAMQLHHMPDESVSVANPRDRLLRLARSLSPKVVTLVEQEANTNTAPFMARFRETLSYYGAVFESLDATLPRNSRERIAVEQHCLARDMVNLVACEGVDRVERHEPMGKWRSRMTMAGFKQCSLSSHVNATIASLLSGYCDKYRVVDEPDGRGAIFLGWLDRPLVSASAWTPK